MIEAELENVVSQTRRNNAEADLLESQGRLETDKIQVELRRQLAETTFANKKAKWYEITLLIAAIVATAALTKLVLVPA